MIDPLMPSPFIPTTIKGKYENINEYGIAKFYPLISIFHLVSIHSIKFQSFQLNESFLVSRPPGHVVQLQQQGREEWDCRENLWKYFSKMLLVSCCQQWSIIHLLVATSCAGSCPDNHKYSRFLENISAKDIIYEEGGFSPEYSGKNQKRNGFFDQKKIITACGIFQQINSSHKRQQ